MLQRLLTIVFATSVMAMTALPVQAGTTVAAVAPAASPVERAMQCGDTTDCPYFPELYDSDRAFRQALLTELKKADIRRPSWVPNGVTTPLRPVEIDGSTRILSSVCEPHNCGHYFLVLYDPATSAVTGLYTGRDKTGTVQTRYFGRPSIAEAALLKNNN